MNDAVGRAWTDFRAGGEDGARAISAFKTAAPLILTTANLLILGILTSVNQILLVLFFMLFIYADQNVSRGRLLAAAGDRSEEVGRLMDAIDRDVRRYLVAKAAISLATGLCAFLGLLALGVPNPALFGLITFVLNFIPTFGSIIAAVFPVTAALLTGSPMEALAVAALFLVINLVFGNLIEPRLLGRELNLSPIVVLIAVVVWASLWGVAGMFVAAPLTRVIQLVFANIPSTRSIAILMSNGSSRSV